MRTTTIALSLLLTSTALAEEHRLTLWGGGGAWNDEETPFHGAAMVGYDLSGLPQDATFSAVLNTETLRLGWHGMRVAEKLWLNFQMTGEALIAGLLPDYYFQGMSVPERGFYGSYVRAQASAKAELLARTYIELEFAGRKWFLNENDDTDDALVLPDDPWIFEPRVHYTWWNLSDDAGWRDRHRPYPRLRGVAVGLSFGVDIRNEVDPWGARDPGFFQPVDPRNDPEQLTIHGSQWLKAGWQMHRVVRTQLDQRAAVVRGGDDLVRPRVGGLNPYVAPLAGAPWASWLPDTYVSALWSWHFLAVEGLELGPLATVVVLDDPHRIGDEDDYDALWGVGALVDWRYGDWQVDLRGGWSPSVEDYSHEVAWNVWLSGGWAGWF